MELVTALLGDIGLAFIIAVTLLCLLYGAKWFEDTSSISE
jgi:hypothetical protein